MMMVMFLLILDERKLKRTWIATFCLLRLVISHSHFDKPSFLYVATTVLASNISLKTQRLVCHAVEWGGLTEYHGFFKASNIQSRLCFFLAIDLP